jgi:hypothetical protein
VKYFQIEIKEKTMTKQEKTQTLEEISKLNIGDDNGSLMSIYAIEDKINEIIDVVNTYTKKEIKP